MSNVSISGLSSGLDWKTLLQQLMQLERQPIFNLQKKQQTYQNKLTVVQNISSQISSFKSNVESLNDNDVLLARNATVNDTSILTATAKSSANEGTHQIKILQLATSHKMANQGWADRNTSSIGTGTFAFKVGSGSTHTITIDTTNNTLDGLKDAINQENAGVTATILNDGTATNPYRLVITSDETGTENEITIVTNDTDLDFANNIIEDATANSGNTYAGTPTSSGTYTGTDNKTYLIEITTAGDVGTAQFKVSEDGGVTWGADDTYGTSTSATAIWDEINSSDQGVEIAFSSGTFAAGDRFYIDVFNPELQEAQDASLMIDNVYMTKSSNTVTDAIEGVTLNLQAADSTKTVDLTITNDIDSVSASIKEFVTQYNTVMQNIQDQFTYNADLKKAGLLMGDNTLLNMQSKLRSIISSQNNLLTGDYKTLSQIGIKSDRTGLLVVDDSKLTDALTNDFEGISELFLATGSTTSDKISYFDHTDETTSGTYSVQIDTVPEKAEVQGDQAIDGVGISQDEQLTFTYNSTNYTVDLLEDDTINTIVTKINNALSDDNLPIAASNSSGILVLTHNSYGSEYSFSVISDRPSSSTSTGIGSTEAKSDTGVDVAGEINGHSAVGSGNYLTGAEGEDEEGLQLSVKATSTGSYGTVIFSRGIAEEMEGYLGDLTNSTEGILTYKKDSFDTIIEDMDEQIETLERRMTIIEQTMTYKFLAMEQLMASLQAQSGFLGSQLSS